MKADLSRRQAVYDLRGLSFREFLALEGKLEHEPVTLADILKSHRRIADIPNSFVVNDDVEVGFGNKIPLWLFGFLY